MQTVKALAPRVSRWEPANGRGARLRPHPQQTTDWGRVRGPPLGYTSVANARRTSKRPNGRPIGRGHPIVATWTRCIGAARTSRRYRGELRLDHGLEPGIRRVRPFVCARWSGRRGHRSPRRPDRAVKAEASTAPDICSPPVESQQRRATRRCPTSTYLGKAVSNDDCDALASHARNRRDDRCQDSPAPLPLCRPRGSLSQTALFALSGSPANMAALGVDEQRTMASAALAFAWSGVPPDVSHRVRTREPEERASPRRRGCFGSSATESSAARRAAAQVRAAAHSWLTPPMAASVRP